jgi:hypothetical protein
VSTWWIHLSWSHAALALLAVLLIFGSLWLFIRSRSRSVDEPRSWPLADYSAEYQKKVRWLGERYLFSKPINRKSP